MAMGQVTMSRAMQQLRCVQRLMPAAGSSTRLLHGLPPTQEFAAEAQYPQIPKSTSKFDIEEEKLTSMIKSLRTVEEKLYYLNKPKYYGWYSTIVEPKKIFYGSLDFAQYTTWTHIELGLPSVYSDLNAEADRLAIKVLPDLTRLLLVDRHQSEAGIDVANDKELYHEAHATPLHPSIRKLGRLNAQDLVVRIDRLLQMHLTPEVGHLRDCHLDYEPRNEAFWFRGGFDPDKSMVKKRLGAQKYLKKYPYRRGRGDMTDEEVHERHDRAIQIQGKAMLQLRSPKMIKPFVAFEDNLCHRHDDIPQFHYDPRTLGYRCECQNGTNTPGFWTNSQNHFTSLQVVSSLNEADRLSNETSRLDDYNEDQREDFLLSKAIFGAFSILLPEACHLGFTPFNDPSHPLVTQTAVTDGLRWKLTAFQLNKTALHRETTAESLNNICWHQPEFNLIQRNEETGQNEVNREGVRDIIKFYLMRPSKEVYSDVQFVHELKDTYNREYFHNTFRYMYSKRSRMYAKPEILAYQKLYMIDHNLWFAHGLRERPWFKMAKINFKGREHWHPEFKHYDHYESAYQPRVFRENKRWENQVKKVVAPIPRDEEDDD